MYYFLILNLFTSSYGFHKNHCLEAMEYCDYELESALHLLYIKYFKISQAEKEYEHGFSEKELIEQRIEEKAVLESIYEQTFKEKIANSVWILNLKLDYLVKIFHKKPLLKKAVEINTKPIKKKKEKCRLFMQGNCKYGANCRFVHPIEEPKKESDDHLNNYQFKLEIRFPKNSKYPFEPPLIFLKTNASLPELMNLHICKRLYQEAENLAVDGMSSVYTITELLQNEEEMVNYINSTQIQFILPNEKLFPAEVIAKEIIPRPTHHKRGKTNRDNKKTLSPEDIQADDKKIVERFLAKSKDSKYIKMCETREKLPAFNLKNNILNTVKSSQVIVISGETGCGKSTQIPQFILDDWLMNFKNNDYKHVEVVCTQPRRISAIGVAERVADERAENVGNTIGYQIRLESKISSNTRLTFCTTGILLRRLELDPTLSNVSHVIVDEVHERSEES